MIDLMGLPVLGKFDLRVTFLFKTLDGGEVKMHTTGLFTITQASLRNAETVGIHVTKPCLLTAVELYKRVIQKPAQVPNFQNLEEAERWLARTSERTEWTLMATVGMATACPARSRIGFEPGQITLDLPGWSQV